MLISICTHGQETLMTSAPSPTATPWLWGVPGGGERRHPAEAEVSLHPEEASNAQQQVAEAVHPQAERQLLTAAKSHHWEWTRLVGRHRPPLHSPTMTPPSPFNKWLCSAAPPPPVADLLT